MRPNTIKFLVLPEGTALDDDAHVIKVSESVVNGNGLLEMGARRRS